ncbi:MAG: NAD+ synthase [Desulfurococcales archaeon]|nr:NAD+ synthase [Desulfurococcales archaeon]
MSLKDILNEVLNVDWNKVEQGITEFIRSKITEAKANGAVIGLSGGVDSALTYALTVKAIGPEKVHTLIMPDQRVTPVEDVKDARELSEMFGVKPHLIEISPIVDVYLSSIPVYNESDTMAIGNLRARIRMSLLYYYANKYNKLVVGTGDRSEILIGYFTKYGDGAVDILPIGILYKTQVRALAEKLGVPTKIARKPSSPRLIPGHSAEGELGLTYEKIDVILHLYFDKGMLPEKILEMVPELRLEEVKAVLERHKMSSHKRTMPPTPPLTLVIQ